MSKRKSIKALEKAEKAALAKVQNAVQRSEDYLFVLWKGEDALWIDDDGLVHYMKNAAQYREAIDDAHKEWEKAHKELQAALEEARRRPLVPQPLTAYKHALEPSRRERTRMALIPGLFTEMDNEVSYRIVDDEAMRLVIAIANAMGDEKHGICDGFLFNSDRSNPSIRGFQKGFLELMAYEKWTKDAHRLGKAVQYLRNTDILLQQGSKWHLAKLVWAVEGDYGEDRGDTSGEAVELFFHPVLWRDMEAGKLSSYRFLPTPFLPALRDTIEGSLTPQRIRIASWVIGLAEGASRELQWPNDGDFAYRTGLIACRENRHNDRAVASIVAVLEALQKLGVVSDLRIVKPNERSGFFSFTRTRPPSPKALPRL